MTGSLEGEMYDPSDYTTWEWRAEYRDASPAGDYLEEWQVNAYPRDGGEGGWVCSLGAGHAPEDERAARLIAGAPNLLDALRELLVWCETDGDPETYGGIAERADAAITKAVGRTGG